MGLMRRHAWLPLSLWAASAAAAPRGSLEVGALTVSQTVIGEAKGDQRVYQLVDNEPGYGLGLGVEWSPATTVRLGVETFVALIDLHGTEGLAAQTHVLTYFAPRMRLDLPLGGGFNVDGHLAIGLGYVSTPMYGSLTLNHRLGVGLAYAFTEETAVFIAVTHLAAGGWPVQALTEDHAFPEPLFAGLSTVVVSVGVRGLR